MAQQTGKGGKAVAAMIASRGRTVLERVARFFAVPEPLTFKSVMTVLGEIGGVFVLLSSLGAFSADPEVRVRNIAPFECISPTVALDGYGHAPDGGDLATEPEKCLRRLVATNGGSTRPGVDLELCGYARTLTREEEAYLKALPWEEPEPFDPSSADEMKSLRSPTARHVPIPRERGQSPYSSLTELASSSPATLQQWFPWVLGHAGALPDGGKSDDFEFQDVRIDDVLNDLEKCQFDDRLKRNMLGRVRLSRTFFNWIEIRNDSKSATAETVDLTIDYRWHGGAEILRSDLELSDREPPFTVAGLSKARIERLLPGERHLLVVRTRDGIIRDEDIRTWVAPSPFFDRRRVVAFLPWGGVFFCLWAVANLLHHRWLRLPPPKGDS